MGSSQPSQSQPGAAPNQQNDPVEIATNVLMQSNGDAKKAFYTLAEQKGVDPDSVLDQIRHMGDPKTIFKNMLASNPRIGGLINLFGSVK